jgi:hypothetical protein
MLLNYFHFFQLISFLSLLPNFYFLSITHFSLRNLLNLSENFLSLNFKINQSCHLLQKLFNFFFSFDNL